MPIYPGYVCVGQSQDPLPVGSVDEEAIWLGDGRDVGPQRGIGTVWDRHQVGAQLALPAALRVWDVHASALVTVWAGAVGVAGWRVNVKQGVEHVGF